MPIDQPRKNNIAAVVDDCLGGRGLALANRGDDLATQRDIPARPDGVGGDQRADDHCVELCRHASRTFHRGLP